MWNIYSSIINKEHERKSTFFIMNQFYFLATTTVILDRLELAFNLLICFIFLSVLRTVVHLILFVETIWSTADKANCKQT